jgi:hypothetical protein
LRAGHRVLGPTERGELGAGGVGLIFDPVVLADAMASLLESSDTLRNLDQAFLAAPLVQHLAEFGEPLLEALGQASDDGGFLLLAPGRMAIQTYFLRVGAEDFLQTDALATGCGELGRLGRIKPPRPLTRDDEIAIAVGPEPTQIVFDGDAAVHDHQGAGRSLQVAEHAWGFPRRVRDARMFSFERGFQLVGRIGLRCGRRVHVIRCVNARKQQRI